MWLWKMSKGKLDLKMANKIFFCDKEKPIVCVCGGKGKGVEGAQGIVLNGENSLAEQIPLISMNFSSVMINAII